MNEESESSSIQANSQNNYKYDKYGFVLVNSIEDLLYDKFNYYTGKELDIIKNKKGKNDNGNINRNYINNPIKRGKRTKENIDKSMKIVLNINNKEKKIFKINPNDSKSIDTMTINDKDTDSRNNRTNKNNKYYNKKDKNDKFLYSGEEDEKNDNIDNIKKMKKMLKNKNSKRPSDSQYLENISETEDEFNNYNDRKDTKKLSPKNMKKNNTKTKNNFCHCLPVLYPCVISKNRKMNPNIKEIPKINREFITKEYENENRNERNKKIMSWPNSTICYFNRSNKIINVNIQIPMQSIINKNYFCTKQIINPNNPNNTNNINTIGQKRLSKDASQNEVIIKILNPEKSPFKYGIINIKARSEKNLNSKDKKYVFKIRGKKDKKNKIKHNLFKNKSSLSRIKCLKNEEIRNALNKKKSKSKSKSNIVIEKECPKFNTLKCNKKQSKLTKKLVRKKNSAYPKEYRISIKTLFRNNLLNNQVKPKIEKEEEKLIRNNSMNKFNKNMIYPYIRRDSNFENNKNKSLSYINKQKERYSAYRNQSKYNPNLFNKNYDKMFPAINSYFH